MLINYMVRRSGRIFLQRHSVKAFSTEVKSRPVRAVNNDSFATVSRDAFVRAYPKLAEKQRYHLEMLSKKHLPVHRSGPQDDGINMALYIFSVLGFLYTMYLFTVHIKST